MEKISFDSRYKFIVSIGLVLSALPFSIIYCAFLLSKDLIISIEDMNSLTDASKELFELKQSLFLNAIGSWIFYVILLFILFAGIILIVHGLYQWKTIQKHIDLKTELENEKTTLENKKLEKEIGLSKEEIIMKVEKEIIIDNELLGEKNIEYTSSDYIDIENAVALRVQDNFGKTHDVVNNTKINNLEYDIIAIGKGFLDKDYIFEVKYVRKHINEKWIKNLMSEINLKAESYENTTNRRPYRYIVIVTEKTNFDFVNNEAIKQIKINNTRIEVVQKENIGSFMFK